MCKKVSAAAVLKLQTGIRGWFQCKGSRSWSWLRITLKSVESIMPTTPRDTQSNDIQHNILKHATLNIDDNQQNNPSASCVIMSSVIALTIGNVDCSVFNAILDFISPAILCNAKSANVKLMAQKMLLCLTNICAKILLQNFVHRICTQCHILAQFYQMLLPLKAFKIICVTAALLWHQKC